MNISVLPTRRRMPWQKTWHPPMVEYLVEGPIGSFRIVHREAGTVISLARGETLVSVTHLTRGKWSR